MKDRQAHCSGYSQRPRRAALLGDPVLDPLSRLALDYLPAYAPELNPVEYIWGYWKHHELPNFCPHDFTQLSYHARHTLRRMRRRPMLVMAFWQQADLFPL
jgi:transposase